MDVVVVVNADGNWMDFFRGLNFLLAACTVDNRRQFEHISIHIGIKRNRISLHIPKYL